MNDAMADAKEIFLEAIERQSPEELACFLDEACAGDQAVRSRVESLLRAHEQAGRFLNTGSLARRCDSITRGPGSVIGPYKLLQQIGEGGMGVVFMAEQSQPVQRTVALKIIKPGMDTRQVIARFEAERQALAMMDHPNIARVLDAGTTEARAGRTSSWTWSKACRSPNTATQQQLTVARAAGAVGCRSARPSSTPIRRASSIATSSPQRAGGRIRRQARPQSHRLRRGQSHRAAAHRADDVHASTASSSARSST